MTMFDPNGLDAIETTDALTAIYDKWLAAHHLPSVCAEEILTRTDLSDDQRIWLIAFYDRWQVVQDVEGCCIVSAIRREALSADVIGIAN